jgi:hypothetical protein
LDDLLIRRWYISQTPASEIIHEAVLAYINRGWSGYGTLTIQLILTTF